MDRATFMRAELFADRRDDEVGIVGPGRPVSPLIEADFVRGRSTYETGFADTNGRANGEDEAPINAVVADPGRQIGRRYCAAAEKGWRARGRRLILRRGRVRGHQKHQTRDAAEHDPSGEEWRGSVRSYGPCRGAEYNLTRNPQIRNRKRGKQDTNQGRIAADWSAVAGRAKAEGAICRNV